MLQVRHSQRHLVGLTLESGNLRVSVLDCCDDLVVAVDFGDRGVLVGLGLLLESVELLLEHLVLLFEEVVLVDRVLERHDDVDAAGDLLDSVGVRLGAGDLREVRLGHGRLLERLEALRGEHVVTVESPEGPTEHTDDDGESGEEVLDEVVHFLLLVSMRVVDCGNSC